MGKLYNVKKMLEDKLDVDVMDWTSDLFNFNDANFIRSFLPQLEIYTDEEIHEWCIENNIRDFMDWSNIVVSNLGLDTDSQEC